MGDETTGEKVRGLEDAQVPNEPEGAAEWIETAQDEADRAAQEPGELEQKAY